MRCCAYPGLPAKSCLKEAKALLRAKPNTSSITMTFHFEAWILKTLTLCYFIPKKLLPVIEKIHLPVREGDTGWPCVYCAFATLFLGWQISKVSVYNLYCVLCCICALPYCAFSLLYSGWQYIVLLLHCVQDDYILWFCYVVSKMTIYCAFATLCPRWQSSEVSSRNGLGRR